MDAMQISSAGMRAQGDRLRVTAENIANADTAANTPNSDPYRRKTVIFKNELDRANDIHTVKVDRVVEDQGRPTAEENRQNGNKRIKDSVLIKTAKPHPFWVEDQRYVN